MWSNLNSSFVFGNSTIGCCRAKSVHLNGSEGYGNYNAFILSLMQRSYKGLTMQSNLTWSQALGTQFMAQPNGVNLNNPYNPGYSYGVQPYDLRYVYNFLALYQPPYFASQRGFVGHALGGWSVAPIFTFRTGYPIPVYTNGNCNEAYGEGDCGSGNLPDNAYLTSAYTSGDSSHAIAPVSGAVGANINLTNGGTGRSMFTNPAAVYGQFAPAILGVTKGGRRRTSLGTKTWNLDLTVSKDFKLTERFVVTFISQFTNILNHVQLSDPYLDLQDPADWGMIGQTITEGVAQSILQGKWSSDCGFTSK